ncbi:MAG: sigma-70 factor domain-containing protein, partial [Gammaproteobacteria bacterium]
MSKLEMSVSHSRPMQSKTAEADGLENKDDDVDDQIETEELNASAAGLIEVEDAVDDFEPGSITEGDLDATRLYLGEIGFSPLLSAEEEVHFAS